MWPYFGQVERIDAVIVRFLFRHQLNLEQPFRIVSLFDAFKKVALMRFTVFGNDSFRFLIGQIFDSLHCTQVEFYPDTLVVRIDKAVCMTSESVHVAVRIRDTARTHGDSYLM